MGRKFVEYAKLLRLPGLGGLAIPSVYGAISIGVYDLHLLLLLFIVGAFSAIYGFVLNDYADVELDGLIEELKGKPLVKGTISRKNAVAICVLAIMFAFFFTFLIWHGKELNHYRFAAIASLTMAGILGSIYNLYGKKILGSDFLVAISMSLVFLYGALAVGQELGLLTWTIFFLVFNQTLHMNAVEGGIKDADHDHLMGVKNIASYAGVKVEEERIHVPPLFKAFGIGIRSFSAFLVFLPFFFGMKYHYWQIALLLLLLLGVFYVEIRLLNLKNFQRAEIRKLIAAAAFLRYSVVPIMLISLIGIIGGIMLIFLPIVWYVIFTPLLGIKLFQPEM